MVAYILWTANISELTSANLQSDLAKVSHFNWGKLRRKLCRANVSFPTYLKLLKPHLYQWTSSFTYEQRIYMDC